MQKQRAHFGLANINRILSRLERLGNRLPHPTLLFIYLACFVLVLSWVCSALNLQVQHPVNETIVSSENLLTADGIYRIFSECVDNFMNFAPVGVVLVIMLGVGVAEHSGLISAVLKRFAAGQKNHLIAYSVSFVGVLSSLGADVGYVVLIPLAGVLYHSMQRPALAGIAVAFAAVSAGFSANLFLGPVDVMLAGISTEAAQIIQPDAVVSAGANYYFTVASTVLITLVCGWLSNNLIEPRLARLEQQSQRDSNDSIASRTAPPDAEKEIAEEVNFFPVALFSLIFIGALTLCILVPGAPFYSSGQGTNSQSVLNILVPLLALYFALSGYLFGRGNGQYSSAADAIEGMEEAMQTMAYYIVLMFFAAQFVSWFSWSNLGVIAAVIGANGLQNSGIGNHILLLMLIFVAAFINLLIGSASAKWTLIAPIFVPMLMLLGISPEQTQMAYRIGDSSSNIITPLMPYFGIVLAYAQRYDKSLGLGNIIATMLPYSISLFIFWSLFLFLWLNLNLPLGF